MSMIKGKTLKHKDSKCTSELLLDKFYVLRKAFEAGYSGKLRSHKYEETREFTIALNHAIFRANQIVSDNNLSFENTANLETQLVLLRQEYLDLIH